MKYSKITLLISEGPISNVHPSANQATYTFKDCLIEYKGNSVIIIKEGSTGKTHTPFLIDNVKEIILIN